MSPTFFAPRTFLTVGLWLAFTCWMVVLWNLSAGPPLLGDPPSKFPIDKVMHFLYFFAGGLCFSVAAFNSFSWRGWKAVILVAAVMGLVGGLDEWHQTYTPNREGGDPADWAADFAGGLTAAALVGVIYGRWKTSA